MSGSSFSPSPRCRWFVLTDALRLWPRRCAISCSRCSARCSICLASRLLYGAYGTLDIALLAPLIRPEPAVWLAAGLMTAGLLAKTALFPLHLWLPPAHANAPAAASAVLSGLVVKGSFFLVVRLWFDVLSSLPSVIPGTILAALGSAAILFGSVLALRQARLKLLIAYSTVAQIGYLFLMFPLASGPGRRTRSAAASCRRFRTPSPRRRCSCPQVSSPNPLAMTASPNSAAPAARCR